MSMEPASSTLAAFCCFPVVYPTATSGEHLPHLSSAGYPNRKRLPCFDCKFTGYKFASNQSRLQWPSRGAVWSDKTTTLNDCTKDQMSPFDSSYSTSLNGEETKNNKKMDVNEDIDALDVDYNITPLCDTLIDIFLVDKPNPTDWRKLLAFSRHWKKTRPHFFKRCQDRAESEDDPGMRHKLLRLGRKLKEVDEDVQRHNELLELIKDAPSEIGVIVARRRKDFTKDFFNHFYTVAGSYYENPTEQDVLTRLGDMCVAAVQNYDKASESTEEALNTAELKFKDILNSSSVDAACRKIDNLAQKDQLDPELVLMISKAWSTAKESSMVKDEAKVVMCHLYMTARNNLQKLMPKEVRILKYLLMIEDPDEQLCALNDAVSHGVELEGKDEDSLYTTPEQLYSLMQTVLDAYHFSMEAGSSSLINGARDLLRPMTIQRMKELKTILQDKFM